MKANQHEHAGNLQMPMATYFDVQPILKVVKRFVCNKNIISVIFKKDL